MRKQYSLLCLKRPAFLLVVFSVTSLLSPLLLFGQNDTEKGLPFITNYSYKTFKALPQTWCVQEDDRGMMYFGIQNHILEYDGIKWRKITPHTTGSSIVVRAMTKNKNGRIYFGGLGDFGFLEIDSLGQTRGKSLLEFVPRENRTFSDIWSAYATDNSIYFQAREYIFRVSEPQQGSEKRDVKVWKPQTKFMYSFYLDGNYYVHQQGLGLFKMTNDSLVLIPGSEFLGKERMQVMLPYDQGGNGKQYLLGLFYGGLYLYDGNTFRRFVTGADPFFQTGAILYKGIRLKNGNYALASTGLGLMVIDANGKLLQRINRDVGLQDESIYGTYEDKKGTLWLAMDNGISRVETSSPLSQFTLQSGINTGVLTVIRFDGDLYVGSTNGLLKFDKSKAYFNLVPGIPQNQIFNLLSDGEELLVPGDGLFAVKNGKATTIRSSVSADLTVGSLHVLNSNPDVLVAGGVFGVYVFTKKNTASGTRGSGTWNYVGKMTGITDQVWNIVENKDGEIWGGTQNGITYRFTIAYDDKGIPDLQKTKVERFGAEAGIKNALGVVYNIKGVNYFVADSALYKFDNKLKRFVVDTTFGTFPNAGLSTEFDIAEDYRERVWIRAGKLIRLAVPKPGGGYTLDDNQLGSLSELTIQKLYPEKNGILWLGTTDGLIRYDENVETSTDQSFKTLLRHVSAEKMPLTINNEDKKRPSISYNNNTLRFEYAAPFFEQESRTQYQTWLEGFEPSWSDLDVNYYKEYTNLSPGKYTFHVRAVNVFHKQSDEAVYSFEILPPWYRTWWAYALYALAAAGILGLIVRYRTRQLKAKHKELENLVAQRTGELSHRVEELAVINSVQEGLVKEVGMQDIYDMVGEKIRAIFNAQIIDIATYDKKTNLLQDKYAYEKGDRTLVGSWEPKGFRKHVIETGQLLLIDEKLEQKSFEFSSPVIHGEQPKSAVFVPLITNNEVKGMISLQNLDKEHAFPDSSIRLLTTLANSMSVALESARRFDETNRLLKETEQRTAELAVINSAQEGLAKELDMQAIYDLVGNKIADVFKENAQAVLIASLDQDSRTEHFNYVMEKEERFYLKPRQYDKLREHLIESKQKILISENYQDAAARFGMKVLPGTEHPKSLLFVPLISGDKVKSYVSLQNVDKERAFSESDVRLLETLANSMSVALANARLFDETNRLLKETEQRNAELAVINSVQESLVARIDIQGIYELVGEKIREIFDAQVIDIVTYDKTVNLIEDRYAYEKGDRTTLGPREPKGFRKHVIQSRQMLMHNENVEQKMKEFDNEVLIGDIPKSQMYVPMIAGNEVKGVISLQNLDHENAFTNSDVNLLTTLANSMSVALESARLFDETNRLLKETEQRNAELGVINSVQDGLVRKMDMEGIYEMIGEKIREIFDAQVIDIVTYDHKSDMIVDMYSYEKGDRTLVGPRPASGFRRHIIETGQELILNSGIVEKSEQYNNPVILGEIAKSAVFVPMKTGEMVSGIISLQNLDHEHAFSDSDVRLITTLSNSMSIALESARLFDETKHLLKETEQRNAELAVINSVQDGLVREMDIQGIYDLVGEKMREIFDAQVIDIVTYDRKGNTIEDRYSFEKGDRTLLGKREPVGFRKHVIETMQALYFNEDVEKHAKDYNNPVLTGESPKSLVFVPMIAGNEVTGVISLQNVDHENAFSASDRSLLTTLSNSMSVALESARLFDETARLLKETEQRNAELAVINSVQESLVAQMDMQSIYELVGEKMREIFNAQVIDIVTYDKKTNHIEDRYAYEKGDRTLLGSREPKGFRRYVIQTAQMLAINKDVEKLRPIYDNAVIVGQAAKSLVLVPMVAGGEVNGVISLQNVDEENAFSDSDISLLSTLVNSMSVALKSARLFDETNRLLKETEQRNAELAVINSVQESLVAQIDIQSIYDLVGEKMRTIFNAQVIDIVTYDKESNVIEDRYSFEKGDRTLVKARAPKGFRKHVIQSGQILVINKDIEKLRPLYDNTVVTGQAAKSVVLVPMIAGGEVTGVISLQNLDQEDAFSESDVSLLSTLVNSMSVALKSARLFDETNRLLKETEQRTAELAVINSVQEGLAKELDIQGIYNLVGERLCDLFPDSHALVIRTFDHETKLETWQFAQEKGSRQFIDPRPFNWNSKLLIETRKPLDIRENYVQIAKVHGSTGVTAGQPPKSAVFVPMVSGDVVKGSVSLQNVDKENAFSDADIRLLTTITNSMSVALENARLFEETNRLLNETEQKTAELAVINSVQEGLVREMHIQAIYDLVGTRICELFDTQTVIIRTFEHRAQIENWQYAIEKGQRLYSNPRQIIWANKLLIESKQALLINQNYLETAQKYGGAGVSKGLPPKSALFVPMVVGDVVRGSVSLQNVEKENAFTDSDLRLLTTLTNSMSVAIENARLFDETNRLLGEAKQRATELSTVNSISQALTSQLNTEELIKLVGDQMKNLFNANIVYLALLDEKTKIIHFPYMEGDTLTPMKLGKGLTSKIILSGKPLLINKEVTAKAEELGITSVGVPAASYLGVPIPVGDEIIGVLSVQSTESENRFNENDERLLSTIAASVGVALRKAQLFEEVSSARKQAEEATKVAEKANQAKSAFLSTVSHELRTPLTSVLGFAKIIKKRLEEKIFPATSRADPKIEKTIQQVSDNLNVVVSEGERLTNLINEVLDLAKIEAGKMEWNMESVSMQEIMERATAATTSLFEQKNLALEKYIEPNLPLISGDRDKLIQVVVNLISNAVKFTPAGKVICRAEQRKHEIVVGIQDTGIGIAPHDHAAVFEQFKQVVGDTLTDKPKGTGLGLPICKEIVEHHEGRIWLESELGKGSTFYFALPIPKTDGSKPIQFNDLVRQLKEQMAHSQLKMNGNHATILVVDDDDSIRSLLQQELGDAGYLIEEAKNGKEALASIRNHRPDLVILDVMMPEMNGFDVAAVLKNDPETMDIPIIVLSIVQDKARGFKIGVDRYLTKPIDTTQLFSEVGSLLEQGKSKKKVMVVDEDTTAVRSLTDVLQAKGYVVVESDGKELLEKAISAQPDIIILNSVISDKHEIVQSLRFEKGLENVLFLVYQ